MENSEPWFEITTDEFHEMVKSGRADEILQKYNTIMLIVIDSKMSPERGTI